MSDSPYAKASHRRQCRNVLISVCLTAIFTVSVVCLAGYLVFREKPEILANPPQKLNLRCQVLIIGSGFAGSYAAYRLAPVYKEQLCLVEASKRDGGRIYDISEYPGGPVFGAGALRVLQSQTFMHQLADELEMEMQAVDKEVDLVKVRGKYYYRGENIARHETADLMCHHVFPSSECSHENATDGIIWQTLSRIRHEFPYVIPQHPDFPSLLRAIIGTEGLAYFTESAFHSLLTSISHKAALEFIEHEAKTSGPRSYPHSGMSQYIIRMLNHAKNHGINMYRNEPVMSLHEDSKGAFHVETKTMQITAERVLCSIDPINFPAVSGNVAERVKDAAEFQAIAPKTSITVAAWWSERWWENSTLYKYPLTVVSSHASCFNGMEIATYPYGKAQNVTRVVYDDGACLDTWRLLIKHQDNEVQEKLVEEVRRSLQEVFHDVTVPRPRTMKGYIHDNAWHFQKPTSQFSNVEVFQWSLQPLSSRNFSLIGEAYSMNQAGWADAALRSTVTVLRRFYNIISPGFDLESAETESPIFMRDAVPSMSPHAHWLRLH